jgi:hypothetical protein
MMWHWTGSVAGALGVAFIVGVLLYDLFPERLCVPKTFSELMT